MAEAVEERELLALTLAEVDNVADAVALALREAEPVPLAENVADADGV